MSCAVSRGRRPEALAADPQGRERFDREARTISRLTHPHICRLHDVGNVDGIEFLVMEYLEGETLAARLDRGGALKIDEAFAIAFDIASALDAAHRAGIVHRDLKPGSVMLTKSGAKLLDFGSGDKFRRVNSRTCRTWADGHADDNREPAQSPLSPITVVLKLDGRSQETAGAQASLMNEYL